MGSPESVGVKTADSLSIEPKPEELDSLWNLFSWAARHSNEEQGEPQDFSAVLGIYNMGVKTLTQCLFLINPCQFIPVDDFWYKPHEKDALEKSIKDEGWERYIATIEEVKHVFPGCEFYEIYRACTILHESAGATRHFFQIGTYASGSKDKDFWPEDFKPNNWVYTGGPGDQHGWADNAKNTAKNGHYKIDRPKPGDIILVRTGAYQGKAIGIVEYNEYAESEKLDEDRKIHVVWINKTESELIRTLGQPLGFSGAKTMYRTFRETPSYTPTFEFIEMPKPVKNIAQVIENAKNFNKLTPESNSYVYEEKVFNSFTHWYYFQEYGIFAPSKFIGYENTTLENYRRGEGRHGGETEKILKKWFRPLEQSSPLFKEISTKLDKYVRGLGRKVKKNFRIHIEEPEAHTLSQEQEPETMKNPPPLNQILFGPPGTGKTWNTVNLAVAIIDDKSVDDLKDKDREEIKDRFDDLKRAGQIEMVTFHQNYSYEDFIEGIRPVLVDRQQMEENEAQEDTSNLEYQLSDGIFKKIVKRAESDRKQNYVLIIDEINRGNIAKIFGELITLIEDSKRINQENKEDQTTVILPYSQKPFGVPVNLYIIGTMNTADRSIALLDTALRRRFRFIEMMPDMKRVSEDVDGVNCRKMLKAMNKRIQVLFDREHQIGHTYFIKVSKMNDLADTFKFNIIPLLQEYFYDDWEKIDLVLNKNDFIQNRNVESSLFQNSDLVDTDRPIYELIPVNDDKWQDKGSYTKIYSDQQLSQNEQDTEAYQD